MGGIEADDLVVEELPFGIGRAAHLETQLGTDAFALDALRTYVEHFAVSITQAGSIWSPSPREVCCLIDIDPHSSATHQARPMGIAPMLSMPAGSSGEQGIRPDTQNSFGDSPAVATRPEPTYRCAAGRSMHTWA